MVNVNWLGDCVLTLPIFKAIRNKFPQSYIGVMVVGRLKELFQNNPYIDKVMVFDEKTTHKNLFSKLRFIKMLRKEKFEVAILLHRSFTRALITALAGIKVRVGWKRLKNRFVLTKEVSSPKEDLHRQDRYFSLLEGIGIPVKEKQVTLFVDEEEKKKISKFLEGYRLKFSYLVAINPSCNWHLKRWEEERFALVADRLIEELNCCVFLIGAKKDSPIAEKVAQIMRNQVVNLCGKTTLKTLVGFLQEMDILISCDSGPAHLAATLGKKVLVLFGPTLPSITGPRGRNVYMIKKEIGCKLPCYNLNCRDNRCMKEISPEEVYQQAKRIILDKH